MHELGDMLVRLPKLEQHPAVQELPSPATLMHKIILMVCTTLFHVSMYANAG
jgi:hypothetical protein